MPGACPSVANVTGSAPPGAPTMQWSPFCARGVCCDPAGKQVRGRAGGEGEVLPVMRVYDSDMIRSPTTSAARRWHPGTVPRTLACVSRLATPTCTDTLPTLISRTPSSR